MLVGINDDGDENNDVLFENRDVVSSLVVETVVTTITSWALAILFGALSHFQPFTFTLLQLGPGDTVWWQPFTLTLSL